TPVTTSNARDSEAAPMNFDVDTALLGPSIMAGDIDIRPPADWPAAPTAVYNLTAAAFEDGQELLAMRQGEMSKMYIVRVDAELAAVFEASVNKQFPDAEFARYRHADRTVHQWIIVDGGETTLKLFLPTRDGGVQVDYVVPTATWTRQAKAIESSIGSIQTSRPAIVPG
ncbi:MAG: hypothetical protein AAGK78_13645, partial [Planctomycetota bacterium]